MRTFKKLLAVASVTATATALAVVPAMADPIGNSGKPVTPKASDIVGFGSDTIQNLFDQYSLDYNKTIKASAPHLYSWDATNPKTAAVHDLIRAKTGCAKAQRPNGSSEGILGSAGGPYGLTANTPDPKGGTKFCSDFARSSRARSTLTDPPAGPGGIVFVAFGHDAVTWATNAKSNAPANLTTAQLASIYTCAVTNWHQVGGKNAPINAQLPQTGSGTRKFFLTALGSGTPITPGACVDSSANESPNNLPEENEGVNKYLKGPNVIYPYSIGKYIAQVYHSAKCLNKSCTPVRGVTCKPSKTQNRFGCDTHGSMVLHLLNGTKPTKPFPLPKPPCTTKCPVLSTSFSPAFVRFVFVVVRWSAHTAGNIPKNLEGIFGAKGWICTNKTAKTDLANYGFGSLGRLCGASS